MYAIIRVDDVTQLNLFELANWFLNNYPEIPICVYLMRTHVWNSKGWVLLKDLIKKYGWEAGGHTRHHLYLSLLNNEKLYEEIVGNIQDIEKGLQSAGLSYKVTTFAYPFGNYDSRVEKILNKLGIVGMSYIDHYPYVSFPNDHNNLNNNFILNISTNCNHPPAILNSYFDESQKYGIYVLCLHTRKWKYPIYKSLLYIKNLKFSLETLKDAALLLYRPIFGLSGYETLSKHLDYMINKKTKFITFKTLLRIKYS